jgi:acyl-CoA synthetase (AMP-forming)/AMP-acid ligase II
MNKDLKEQKTIVDAILSYASADPDRLAFRFLGDGDGVTETLTYGELDVRCRAIAACQQKENLSGVPLVLCFEPGLAFVCAFLGSLYAGAVPVPVAVPRPNRPAERLRSIVRDCQPGLELTSRYQHRHREQLLKAVPELAQVACLVVDDIDTSMAAEWNGTRPEPESLAFLQYTSGSISAPKGVAITHSNIVTNQEQIKVAFDHDDSTKFVGWLPLFHDMGLIGNILQPLYLGIECTLLPPLSFIQKPIRWLRAISEYEGTTSGAPNFAYDHCVNRINQSDLAGIDLSSWRVAFNGAEPVRAETIQSFSRSFAPAGFRAETFYPCYGLAEATLFVCGDIPGDVPIVLQAHVPAIESGNFKHASNNGQTREFVSSGIIRDQAIHIVDPTTSKEMPEGNIGEIWVAGENVAHGYWNTSAESSATFGASLGALSSLKFLRTGDLGFIHQQRLFVTGRLKDLIIIRGRNLYPQDIERTVSDVHKSLIPGRCAAFSVEEDGEERLVAVQEVKIKPSTLSVLSEISNDIQSAVAEQHDVVLSTVCLVKPGGVPFTSSGKVRRAHCRQLFLDDQLPLIRENRNRPAMPEPNSFVRARRSEYHGKDL